MRESSKFGEQEVVEDCGDEMTALHVPDFKDAALAIT